MIRPQWSLCMLAAVLATVCYGAAATAVGSSSSRPLKFLFAPLLGNSPALDLMGVAAQLQSRGHTVAVVVVPSALEFVKSAAARHSSNTTAEAMQYITLELGMEAREAARPAAAAAAAAARPTAAAAAAGKQSDGAQGAAAAAGERAAAVRGAQAKQKQPARVTRSRFTVAPSLVRSLTLGMELLMTIQDVVAQPCARILASPDTLQQLRDFQPDAVAAIGLAVAGGSSTDSCGCLLSHALGVPLVDVDGNGMWVGPPSVAQFGSGLSQSDLHTLPGFLQNLATWLMRQLLLPLLSALHPSSWVDVRQQLGLPRAASACPMVNAVDSLRGVRLRKCESVVGVVLGSWLLEQQRALAANQVLVGPGTPRPAHPITDESIAQFVTTAPAGLVLVAFGTSYQFNSWLSPKDFEALAQGFAALAPIRVLWNLNDKGLPAGLTVASLPLGSNTKVVEWVDYNDVLGHNSTRLLVSHCGLHSIYEAMFHGVPVVGLPYMFEQAETCSKLAARGAAVLCKQAPAFRAAAAKAGTAVQYDSQHIAQLITEVLNNPDMSAAARRLSAALRTYAARRHPYERAADEIELAVRTLHAQQAVLEVPVQQQPADGGYSGQQQQQQGQQQQQFAAEQEHEGKLEL